MGRVMAQCTDLLAVGGCSQRLGLWVGEDDAPLCREGKFIPHPHHGGKKVPFPMTWALPAVSASSFSHGRNMILVYLRV